MLRSNDKLLKIGDFGTACRAHRGRVHIQYVATRWYRAPECVLTMGRYGTKMDVWAAGCVLYEMATGQPLFDGSDESDQMDKIDRVLGRPNRRLLSRFGRYKSSVFVDRYETSSAVAAEAEAACGLQSLYSPYNAAFELLKNTIVYDPTLRYSADLLLRKPYFAEIRGTCYEQKMIDFEKELQRKSTIDMPAGERKVSAS